jgi:hypothetical protein
MYCPNCGQQQIADNTRFCSRCGLPTDGLARWLAGQAAFTTPDDGTSTALSPRRKGIRRGGKIIFFSGVLLPIFVFMSAAADSPGPLVFPFTLFLIGITILLYAILFSEKTPPKPAAVVQPNLGPAPGGHALPPASNTWAHNVRAGAVRTSELVQGPPSVTENTTKLLRDEQD